MQDQAFVEIGKIALTQMGIKEPFQLFIQKLAVVTLKHYPLIHA
jgi:hypothetical protein